MLTARTHGGGAHSQCAKTHGVDIRCHVRYPEFVYHPPHGADINMSTQGVNISCPTHEVTQNRLRLSFPWGGVTYYVHHGVDSLRMLISWCLSRCNNDVVSKVTGC